jgi:hypothetical protein
VRVKVYDGRVGKLLSDVVVKVEYRRRKGKMLEYDMRQLKLTKSRFFPTAPSTLQVLLAGEDGRGVQKFPQACMQNRFRPISPKKISEHRPPRPFLAALVQPEPDPLAKVRVYRPSHWFAIICFEVNSFLNCFSQST